MDAFFDYNQILMDEKDQEKTAFINNCEHKRGVAI